MTDPQNPVPYLPGEQGTYRLPPQQQSQQPPAYGQPQPYGAGPGYYPPPKKKRRGMIVGLVVTATLLLCGGIGVAALVSASGSNTSGPGVSTADGAAAKGGKTIVLEITGPPKADITYEVNSDQSQANGEKLPWKKTVTSKELETIVVLSAQNSGSGEIDCSITINGKAVKRNASKGQYSIVTCEATA